MLSLRGSYLTDFSFLSVGMSPWNLVGFFVSLSVMIFLGYSIWRVEKERKNALGSSRTHEEVLPKGGGGPLIH